MARTVVFEKHAVERTKWSALLAIGDALKKRGHGVEYFVPTCFTPPVTQEELDAGEVLPSAKVDMPNTPIGRTDAIFTWAANYLNIQEYYARHNPKCDIYTVDWGFLAADLGYQFVLKNGQFPKGCPQDRFDHLGIPIADPGSFWDKDGHVLVCRQNHHESWYDDIIREANTRKKKTRKLKIREYYKRGDKSAPPLEDDLKGAFAVITYNSTVLYQALLRRIPVFVSPACPASVYCETSVYKLEKATECGDDVKGFLSDVAYSQYTLEELRRGEFVTTYQL